MLRSRRLFALVAHSKRTTAGLLTRRLKAALALLGVALLTSSADAQGQGAGGTPLHLASSRFEFVATDSVQPSAQPIRVHNGGNERFTDVRLTKLTYADSARGVRWLIAQPKQTTVAPDELATVGTLCVNTSGLAAGTYRATAAIAAREVPEPVAFTITLVVNSDDTRSPHSAPRCAPADAK